MPATTEMQLQPDQPQTLETPRASELRVAAGIVWLTIPGQALDIFLHAGESRHLPMKTRVVIEAMRDSARISLSSPSLHGGLCTAPRLREHEATGATTL